MILMYLRYKYSPTQSFKILSTPTIISNYSLKTLNTFGVDVAARRFAAFRSVVGLSSLLNQDKDIFLLGGGSNLLLTKNIDKLVLKNEIFGIQIVERSKHKVLVKCGGGEQWHDFVLWCVGMGFGGIENLSLIPGCVGTAPIQNIGAYGVELKDVMHSLDTLDIHNKVMRTFSNEDCKFAYRDSIFKNQYKDQFCITSVTFELTTVDHKLSLDYGNIKDMLSDKNIDKLTIKDVSEAVISIRQSKLPDPDVIGNSGSFFKNPIVDDITLEQIKKQYPDLRYFDHGEGSYKIPAAWLIDKLGLKGFRNGAAGIYDDHALVLVNHGGASGIELYDHAMVVRDKVRDAYGVELVTEVNVF